MGGIEFREGELVVEREPNELDRLAITFTAFLDELGIRHAYVAGYVAVLTGRARATQDIDVLIEPLNEDEMSTLTDGSKTPGCGGRPCRSTTCTRCS